MFANAHCVKIALLMLRSKWAPATVEPKKKLRVTEREDGSGVDWKVIMFEHRFHWSQ
jgi:hypothetical protein